MNRQLTILIIALLTALTSFGHTDTTFTKAYRYKTDKFDVAIFPSNYFDLIGGQRFTPTREEIEKAEQSLWTGLKILNKNLVNQSSTPIIHKNLSKYKRQYLGILIKTETEFY